MSQGDKFYKLFLGDCALGPQCFFKCKYKFDQSAADIRIGDFWGDTYKDNEDGVSAVIAFSNKGKEIIESTNCILKKYPFIVATEGQMRNCPPSKKWHKEVLESLSNPLKDINDAICIVNNNQKKERIRNLLQHPVKTILNKIRGRGHR